MRCEGEDKLFICSVSLSVELLLFHCHHDNNRSHCTKHHSHAVHTFTLFCNLSLILNEFSQTNSQYNN